MRYLSNLIMCLVGFMGNAIYATLPFLSSVGQRMCSDREPH